MEEEYNFGASDVLMMTRQEPKEFFTCIGRVFGVEYLADVLETTTEVSTLQTTEGKIWHLQQGFVSRHFHSSYKEASYSNESQKVKTPEEVCSS